jgi:hypothetical protein
MSRRARRAPRPRTPRRRLQATTSPTGTINNLRWFSDGSNNYGTGVRGQDLVPTIQKRDLEPMELKIPIHPVMRGAGSFI